VSKSQTWTHFYRPIKRSDFVGNQDAVTEFVKWIMEWNKKIPKKKAVFLYGPPGIGKTSITQVLANEFNFELVEVNASDKRNKATLEEELGKNTKQNVTIFGKKRMILVDEMDGLSGKQDRGGISAISHIIDDTISPIVLVANTVEENMESRFRSILKKVKSIEFKPINHNEIITKLKKISKDQGKKIDEEVLEEIAINSKGDLRSAINDLETLASGRDIISLEDLGILNSRDKLNPTVNILNTIFTSGDILEARKTINQSMISYDDLFEWIYENIPVVLDDPNERLEALKNLAKADIYQKRARMKNWRLLKYFFDLITGGITISRKKSIGQGYKEVLYPAILSAGIEQSTITTKENPEGIMVKPNKWLGRDKWSNLNKNLRKIGGKWIYGRNVWIIPYYREPQTKWRYITTFHKRRVLGSVTRNLAKKCHTSTDEVKKEILPLFRYMIRNSESMHTELSKWLLNISSDKLDYIRFMSFDKTPSDFVNLTNYSKYKNREIKKMLEQATKQRNKDELNIEKWLQEESKNAIWNYS
jgi:replication factor C large subunit